MINQITELKDLVTQSRSCRFSSGNLVVESKVGQATLTIPNPYHYAFVQLRRVSGNGKLTINGKDVLVLSKISYSYRLEYTKEIIIRRPPDGQGEVAILGINLHTEEFNEEDLSQNWRSLLGRCRSYGYLRLVKDKLFASEGAFISNASVISAIETTPPGAFHIENDVVKFYAACEISRFEVSPTAPTIVKSTFEPRNPVVPITLNAPPVTPTLVERPGTFHVNRSNKNITNPVLYDSSVVAEFAAGKILATKTVKTLRSNNIDYLVLRTGGSYQISSSFLRPNVEYVAVINAKKLNGNGRLQLEIIGGSTSNIIIENEMLDYYVSVKSGAFLPENGGKITISIPASGIGEIIISKIQIIEGVQLYSFRNLRITDPTQTSQQSYEVAKMLSSLNVQYGAMVDNNTMDPIALITKRFARQKICFGAEETNLSVNGTVMATNFDGINWLNKVSPLFPTIMVQKTRTDTELTASIGNKFGIQPATKIWIEPFDTLDDKQLDVLRNAKMILTPSLPNANYLDSKLPRSMVVQAFKPIPFIPPQEVPYFKNLEYVVAFNRNKHTTQRLLDAWDSSLPRLVLIGARGRFPSFVTPINEYFEYQKLLYILLQAKCVVDLPTQNDYISGMLHFCEAAGLPIVSSNWFVIDKPNCDLVLTNETIENFKVPSVNGLHKKIVGALARRRENSKLTNYNDNLNSFMSLLMGSI